MNLFSFEWFYGIDTLFYDYDNVISISLFMTRNSTGIDAIYDLLDYGTLVKIK